MLETLATSLVALLAVKNLAYMMLGIFVGLAVGILPGLGGIAGMALLIPFIHGMDQTTALAMLIGMVAVIPTGDTFTSVLMGIPGSSASQATVVDGYPLAKKGQAARALSAAFSASLLGGVFGAIVLTFFVIVAKPLILFFSSAELFMLAILGLSVVGVLAGGSVIRGVAACGLGLMFGAIGDAPATGEVRASLGLRYLDDGIPLVIIGLGLFAFPELTDLIRRGKPIASGNVLGAGWLQGLRDTVKHWFLVIRCSVLGVIVGAIPGLGGGVVDWIAYGHVVQTSRDQSQFGKGDIRGVIAPESANNALQGGALMPTILFGIPGSGAMAVFLGGMVLIGISPGPSMVTTDLSLTYTIAWTLALASIIGAAICFFLAAPIAQLTKIPFNYVAPFMLMIICFASFQARRDIADLFLLFGTGILGIFMRRFGWPRSAFLIGFVLASQAETYLYQAVQFYGWGFLTRTGVIVIGVLALISILLALRGRVSEDGKVSADSEATLASRATGRGPQIVFASFILIMALYVLVDALRQSFLGGVFPGGAAAATGLFTLLVIYWLVRGPFESPVNTDQEASNKDGTTMWPAIGWFTLLFALAGIAGFIIAIAIFIPTFLIFQARKSVPFALAYTALCVAFMVGMGYMLTVYFPPGLLQSWVNLPWPLK